MDEGRNMILLFPGLIKWKSDEEREKFKPSYAFLSFTARMRTNMMEVSHVL